jgi:dinuclear metal center YbgI/SA1388 family protein
MLVAELETALEGLAPKALAEPGDNCGLLVGSEQAAVSSVLVALELTEPVLEEAVAAGHDTVLTHHPLLFSPLRSLVDSRLRERLVRRLIAAGINLFACHTNLDSAPGGLADAVGEALGLQNMRPLQHASAGWYKLVGFMPPESAEDIAAAIFAAGAGTIGEYRECAFASEGRGWFTPGPAAHPTVGERSVPQRTPELRWEAVVPQARLAAVIAAYVDTHPYEEPAFDIYPVRDVVPNAGLGRVGTLAAPTTVRALAGRVGDMFEVGPCRWSGEGERSVRRVGVVPGSGRSLLDTAAASCEILVTGDLGYHDAERAAEMGLSLIAAPHGELEWWALRRWTETSLRDLLAKGRVKVSISREWRSPWEEPTRAGPSAGAASDGAAAEVLPGAERLLAAGLPPVASQQPLVRIRVDGGSRGNPGPSAIGVVLEDAEGRILQTVGQTIGVTTNNVAEYRALLTGLELAEGSGAREVEVLSDSELLVRQMGGEYRVKNEGLKPLHAQARALAERFDRIAIIHVSREENTRADELVNQALDTAPPA